MCVCFFFVKDKFDSKDGLDTLRGWIISHPRGPSLPLVFGEMLYWGRRWKTHFSKTLEQNDSNLIKPLSFWSNFSSPWSNLSESRFEQMFSSVCLDDVWWWCCDDFHYDHWWSSFSFAQWFLIVTPWAQKQAGQDFSKGGWTFDFLNLFWRGS